MGFIKVIKNKAYFRRYQTKFRRRREGKTDYRARRFLTTQAKNKYGTPKYRVVVRITNRDVIGQVVSSKIQGDEVFSYAYSHELKMYGIKFGLTNWTAAYATGFLLARRTLKKISLDEAFPGKEELDGEEYNIDEANGDANPFTACLDIGLRKATTGSRVFAFLKGACDGGLAIPNSDSRLVGYDPSTAKVDTELLSSYIYGGHVSEYMERLMEDDEETYERHFSTYIKSGISPDNIKEIYENAYEAIRQNPFLLAPKKERTPEEMKASKAFKKAKMNRLQRKDRVRQKIASFKAKLEKKDDIEI